jgi:hypothetical protein
MSQTYLFQMIAPCGVAEYFQTSRKIVLGSLAFVPRVIDGVVCEVPDHAMHAGIVLLA